MSQHGDAAGFREWIYMELHIVELSQAVTMSNTHNSNFQLQTLFVHVSFHVYPDLTCRFIQNWNQKDDNNYLNA